MVKLSEIPFTTDNIKQKHIDQARKSIPDILGQDRRIAFSVTCEKQTLSWINQPCHGKLCNYQNNYQKTPLIVTTALNFQAQADEESMKFFYDWFVNEGFGARFILNRETYWEDKAIMVSGNLWFPFMNLINIVARHSVELPLCVKEFKQMVDGGLSPKWAFILALNTNMSQTSGGTPYKYATPADTTIVVVNAGHRAFQSLGPNLVKNYFEDEIPGYVSSPLGTFTAGNGRYYEGSAAWSVGDLYGSYFLTDWMLTDKELQARMRTYRGEDGAESKIVNPFLRSATAKKPEQVSRKEIFDVIIPYIKEKQIYGG